MHQVYYIMLNVILWAFVIIVGILLFKKAAGTLDPCKINLISLAFYYILIQTIIGAALTSIGFVKHYTYVRLAEPEKYTMIAGYFSILVFIMLPLVSISILKILKIDSSGAYNEYLRRKTDSKYSEQYFALVLMATVVSSVFLILLIKEIGYIPLWELFTNKNMDFATERSRNVKISILGMQHLKNLLVLYGIPMLSWISFGFVLATRSIKWELLFTILLIESIIVKTYDFSKAPIVVYLIVMVLIIIFYNGGIRFKQALIACLMGVGALIIAYRKLGFNNSFFDIYNGILGRTIFTQFGTLAMHLEAFPKYLDFLHGKSLYPTILNILGLDRSLHVRSAELVMGMYNSEGIFQGNSGVMNTLFVGEAYANWGVIGAIFGIILVATILTVCFVVFLKLKKTPITISFFAILTQQLTSCIQGGFVDYIYNSSFAITILLLVVLYNVPCVIEYFKNKGSNNEKNTKIN